MDIYLAVDKKESAGYNTTITDYWGRGLSYQLINAPDGGLCTYYIDVSIVVC